MTVCEFPSNSYADWEERLKKRLDSRLPLQGALEITARCNLRCVHCYVAHCSVDPDKKEFSYQEYRHLLDQITEAGCLQLLMTGGEPLMRKDFLD
ncbi:MAG: radical SAM protein, partial [Chloroflexota bacterium]